MKLVQTVRITQKDKWEQNGGKGRAKKRHLVNSTNSSTLPASKTTKVKK